MKYISVMVTILVVNQLFGCAQSPTSKESIIKDTLFTYHNLIRWGEYKRAAKFHKIDSTKNNKIDYQHLKQIKITAYNENGCTPKKEGYELYCEVEIEFQNINSAKIQSIILNQHWEFDKNRKLWLQLTPLPSFI